MPDVFGLPPGADFPASLVLGLDSRFGHLPPHEFAKITLIVNTRRMSRRIRSLFDAGPPRLLPRVLLVTELDSLLFQDVPPRPVAPLARRLELARMVRALLATQTSLAEQASVFDLADGLGNLMDEMQGENVSPERIANLDVSQHSEHFAQTKAFLAIVRAYLEQSRSAPDSEERQGLIVSHLLSQWQEKPPQSPVILAGSTASRGTTRRFAEAVAKLDQGCVVLPGFDDNMTDEAWAELLAHDLPLEDHPQFRFAHMLRNLEITHTDVRPWVDVTAPSPARNKVVSLALRPAPVTDAWLTEGPCLGDLRAATRDLSLLEAENPRTEALAIAMRLRAAAQDGQSAALITPDRMLTRQVAAALDRWNIIPDDSAGTPLHLSPPGRLLRHAASLFTRELDVTTLLTLLKHPLTHSGSDRNTHVLQSQRLELYLRDTGVPFPDADSLSELARKMGEAQPEGFADWLAWVTATFCGNHRLETLPLTEWVQAHTQLSEAIASGPSAEATELWAQNAGIKATRVMEDLAKHAKVADPMSAQDYVDLVGKLLAAEEVRDRDAAHPGIMIWGTMEARVQGADLVIMGGLNENTWPEAPAPDPWLNRSLRYQAGLLLPDRRIGLAAHDFQQAIGAPEVMLTRSLRSSDTETVPSRWLNRLTNLLSGLPDIAGPEALTDMRERAGRWIALSKTLETPIKSARATRPSPRPPLTARPRRLSVSDIRRLVRDPYAVYARKCLHLSPLGPLRPKPDALLRGTALHKVFESFLSSVTQENEVLDEHVLLQIAQSEFDANVPWPTARIFWMARLENIATKFLEGEAKRQARARPACFEIAGRLEMPDIGMSITAKADRIDLSARDEAVVYDYKTGTPPSQKAQVSFERQLLIEAAMIENGAFSNLGPKSVLDAQYIGLGANPKTVSAPLESEPTQKVMEELRKLLASYLVADQGYTSRRAFFKESDIGDFDHLARFGEWDATKDSVPEDVG